MTKLSRSIFFVSFREKIKSGYDVEIVISNFFTALYFDTGPSPHSVQIIIHLRFYLSTNNRLPFQKPPCTFSSYNATIRASEKYPILSSGNSFFNRRAIRIPSSSSSTTLSRSGNPFMNSFQYCSISGTLDDMKFKLGKARYKDAVTPAEVHKVDSAIVHMGQQIAEDFKKIMKR